MKVRSQEEVQPSGTTHGTTFHVTWCTQNTEVNLGLIANTKAKKCVVGYLLSPSLLPASFCKNS